MNTIENARMPDKHPGLIEVGLALLLIGSIYGGHRKNTSEVTPDAPSATITPYTPATTLQLPISELTPVPVDNYLTHALKSGQFRTVRRLGDTITIYEDTNPAPPKVMIIQPLNPSIDPQVGLESIAKDGCISDTITWFVGDMAYIDKDGLQKEKFQTGADYVEVVCAENEPGK